MKLMTEAIFPAEFHNGTPNQRRKSEFNQQIIVNHVVRLARNQRTHRTNYYTSQTEMRAMEMHRFVLRSIEVIKVRGR